MNWNKKFALAPVLVAILTSLGVGWAWGYSVYANLEQTHNNLLEQRDHLQRLQGSYNDQINRIQQQLNVVNQYLSDNDRALRDIEEAMRNAPR